MTVMAVLGLMMSMLVPIMAPMLRSQSRSQAKLDTVQTAATVLYRIQRDLRQTYYKSVYACTTGATATCSQPVAFGATSAIAFPTAYQNGTGQFQLQTAGANAGQPDWQGVMVYWIDGQGDLSWAFETPASGFTTGSSGLTSAAAAQVVADASTGVVTGTELATNIQQLAAAVSTTQTNMVSLELVAQSTENGATNKTSYQSDIQARQ